MTTYLRDEHPAKHFKRAEEALEGVAHLTLDDMLVAMGVDLMCCDDKDRDFARRDLSANGYEEGFVSLWGRRAVFPRWVKIAREDGWYAEHLPGKDWRPVMTRAR